MAVVVKAATHSRRGNQISFREGKASRQTKAQEMNAATSIRWDAVGITSTVRVDPIACGAARPFRSRHTPIWNKSSSSDTESLAETEERKLGIRILTPHGRIYTKSTTGFKELGSGRTSMTSDCILRTAKRTRLGEIEIGVDAASGFRFADHQSSPRNMRLTARLCVRSTTTRCRCRLHWRQRYVQGEGWKSSFHANVVPSSAVLAAQSNGMEPPCRRK